MQAKEISGADLKATTWPCWLSVSNGNGARFSYISKCHSEHLFSLESFAESVFGGSFAPLRLLAFAEPIFP